MIALAHQNNGCLLEQASGKNYHYCANYAYGVCNWVIPDADPAGFCVACALNRIIPDLSNPMYRARWEKTEAAKHRLIYSLLQWGLPVQRKAFDNTGLVFDFMADPGNDSPRILTGHSNGVITINIAEADDVEREMARNSMDEVYRTLLGHFRHEIGHYYWDLLIQGSLLLQEFRTLFGNETHNYQEALNRHYAAGAPPTWNENYISAYATMHPWEDWAETWAHYLHIVDTIEAAYSFGLTINPPGFTNDPNMCAAILFNPYQLKDFDTIFEYWLPLTFAMNTINRSMGGQDLYPFVISPEVKEKLRFVHKVIHNDVA
ncbi:putative zinc-binding peptidase [Niabella aquatica]